MRPFNITHILAPTDLSESSVPALRHARVYADRFSAKLTVSYTDPLVYPFDYMTPIEGYLVDATPEQEAHLRTEVERHAASVMEGRSWEIDVTVGQPISGVLATAERLKADFIVIGTHLRRGWRRALLGSVSEGVLHGSHCPVLTVDSRDVAGRDTNFTIRNIVCPINFSEVARESVRVAARIAQKFDAHLTVVHVIEAEDVVDTAADEENLRKWVAPELQDISFRDLVVRGGPAERVLDCADDLNADLLVIGAQHKRFRDATVIGATTERLIRFASCPVLVVPRAPVRRSAKREKAGEMTVGAGR